MPTVGELGVEMLGQKTNCPIRIALPEVIDGVVSDIVTIKARLN